jgi:hypothetical protein
MFKMNTTSGRTSPTSAEDEAEKLYSEGKVKEAIEMMRLGASRCFGAGRASRMKARADYMEREFNESST